jgi:hypothetical protein
MSVRSLALAGSKSLAAMMISACADAIRALYADIGFPTRFTPGQLPHDRVREMCPDRVGAGGNHLLARQARGLDLQRLGERAHLGGQVASCMANIACGNARLGHGHALSLPLEGHLDLPHPERRGDAAQVGLDAVGQGVDGGERRDVHRQRTQGDGIDLRASINSDDDRAREDNLVASCMANIACGNARLGRTAASATASVSGEAMPLK